MNYCKMVLKYYNDIKSKGVLSTIDELIGEV